MSAANFSAALALELSYEGGFSDNPADPGGATNLGVTLRVLSAYRGRECTVADVRALTRADVTPLYKRDYWDLVAGDLLAAGVDLIVFDGAVNQGPGTISRMLQGAAGVAVDGQIGEATLKACTDTPAALLIERVRLRRLAAYQAAGGWPSFGVGWARRLNGIAATATSWASRQAAA